VAPTRTRTKVIRLSGIFLLVATLIATLTFLFQYQHDLAIRIKTEPANRISVIYLRLLIQMQPQDNTLRIELAQKLRDLGRWDEAHETLQPMLSHNGQINWPAWLLSTEIQTGKLFAMNENDPQRLTLIHTLGDEIAALSTTEIPDAHLEELAKLSLGLARPDVAADLYDRLAVKDAARRPEWLAMAGQWRLASNSPQKAGQTYNEASMIATDPIAARQYAIKALEAYRAANDDKTTLSLASAYVARFPDSRQLLDCAIEIARAQASQGKALEWGLKRLSLDPDDKELLQRQLKIALEAGNLSTALKLAQQLVQQEPEDGAAHQQLAQIAEWAGNPRLALTEWRWLARQNPEGPAAMHALGLARGLGNDSARIEMLDLISHQRALEDTEITELTEACGHTGALGNGIKLLRSYLTQHPKQFSAWTALAQLQEQDGQLLAAAATWHLIGKGFNRPIEAACSRAELLWRLNRQDDAFQLLAGFQSAATDDKTAYWKLLGDQAWSLDQKSAALTAYHILWRTDKADTMVAERLIQLARNMNQADEAIAISEAAFNRFGETRFLLLGIDVAIAADSWKEVARLMKTARQEQEQLKDTEMYWLQEALLAVHDGRYEVAQAHYHRAMQINPASVSARVGLLWVLIEANDTRQLPVYLRRWETDAIANPDFWGAYAIAMTKLGWTKRALPWYQRQAKANPQDSALLISYSQTLAKAGETDAAWRLRRHVLLQLRTMTKPGTLAKVNP
jgi:predicted Zn-dependent protease